MDSMVYFETSGRLSMNALTALLSAFGAVKAVGDDSLYCDWSPALPSLEDVQDAELRLEVQRSLFTMRGGQLWWRLNDAAFRTGDLIANISNALRVMNTSKRLVEAKLAKSWSAGGIAETVESRWDTAAFYPVPPSEGPKCAEHGFVMISDVAVSLDILKRFSIVGSVSPPSRDTRALAAMLQRLVGGQSE